LPFHQLTARFAFIVGITALLMNIGESTFYNQLLQASVWLWLGLGAHSTYRNSATFVARYVD
jgi:hypothetical protein